MCLRVQNHTKNLLQWKGIMRINSNTIKNIASIFLESENNLFDLPAPQEIGNNLTVPPVLVCDDI